VGGYELKARTSDGKLKAWSDKSRSDDLYVALYKGDSRNAGLLIYGFVFYTARRV